MMWKYHGKIQYSVWVINNNRIFTFARHNIRINTKCQRKSTKNIKYQQEPCYKERTNETMYKGKRWHIKTKL